VFAQVDDSATLLHTLHMLTWMYRVVVVSCAAVCVLLLFFFPLVHGPFQATHGPTTAFRGRKAFLTLLWMIVCAAMGVMARLRDVVGICSRTFRFRGFGAHPFLISESSAILRC